MRKKLLSLLLTLAMLLSLIPAGYAADIEIVDEPVGADAPGGPLTVGDIVASGQCGDDLYWTLDDQGTLTITGTGDMWDFGSENSPWFDNRYSIKYIDISNDVTSIGNNAFASCTSLQKIQMGDSITTFGTRAFYVDSSLTQIELSCSLASIGTECFQGCNSLKSITFPRTLSSIGNACFYMCDRLGELFFTGDAPAFGNNCFMYMTATAYYPAGNQSWTSNVMNDYGGRRITWAAYEPTPDGLPIDEEHFPDEAFRAYVAEEFDDDGNGYLNDEEIAAITEIDVSMLGISSLQGIEYFPELTVLFCLDNELTALDLTHNPKLEMLDCSFNSLTALDVTQNPALTSIDCSENAITALDVTNNPALEGLFCYGNEIAALDLSGNAALQVLDCSTNRLTALDLSGNPGLVILECYGNSIAELDLTPCPTLVDVVTNGTYEQKANYDSYSKDSYFVHVDPATTLITEEPEGYTITVTDKTKGKAETSLDLNDKYNGDVSFTVTCDQAVLVAVKNGDDEYTVLKCTTEGETHIFTLNVTEDTEIALVLKGDANLDGSLDLKDNLRIKKYVAGDASQISDALALLAGNVNGDEAINLKDMLAIKKAIAGAALAW